MFVNGSRVYFAFIKKKSYFAFNPITDSIA